LGSKYLLVIKGRIFSSTKYFKISPVSIIKVIILIYILEF
jgi:hypothetical protein